MNKENAQKIYLAVREGSMSFDDFYYGFLDDFRNFVFEEAVIYERDEIAKQFENGTALEGTFYSWRLVEDASKNAAAFVRARNNYAT